MQKIYGRNGPANGHGLYWTVMDDMDCNGRPNGHILQNLEIEVCPLAGPFSSITVHIVHYRPCPFRPVHYVLQLFTLLERRLVQHAKQPRIRVFP